MGAGKGSTRRTQSVQSSTLPPHEADVPLGHLPPGADGRRTWPEHTEITASEEKAFCAQRELSPSGTTYHDVYYLMGDAWLCSTEYLKEIVKDATTPMKEKLAAELNARTAREDYFETRR